MPAVPFNHSNRGQPGEITKRISRCGKWHIEFDCYLLSGRRITLSSKFCDNVKAILF
jgi:hypothetical protein